MKGDDIAVRLLDFGARIITLARALPKDIAGRHVAQQLLRSGTGAGSNYEEGRGAESKADFIHKLSVAWKELREATYWLRLIHRSKLVKPERMRKLLAEAVELSAILSASLRTARRNQAK